jgi:hypothetical protein
LTRPAPAAISALSARPERQKRRVFSLESTGIGITFFAHHTPE